MKDDPRRDFRQLYSSKNSKIFPLTEWNEAIESNQATIFTSLVHKRAVTMRIQEGQIPNRLELDENFILLACGHFLGINDILSEGFKTYLARMMDHGIVSMIYSKYYLSDSNIALHLARIAYIIDHVFFQLKLPITLPEKQKRLNLFN